MSKPTDVRPVAAALYFLPVTTRVPLKFGREVMTEVTCARVRLTVADSSGRTADGWGETPLSVQWVWPSGLSYAERHDALLDFCRDRLPRGEDVIRRTARTPGRDRPPRSRNTSPRSSSTRLQRQQSHRRGTHASPRGARLQLRLRPGPARRLRHPPRHPDVPYLQCKIHERRPRRSTWSRPRASSVSFAGLYPEDFF